MEPNETSGDRVLVANARVSHNLRVIRRIHIPHLTEGDLVLPKAEAHHLRDVLRLQAGAVIELFTDDGRTAEATLLSMTAGEVVARVLRIAQPERGWAWTIASAVPKGERAEWMIEKISELGAEAFIPLAASRSVVLPEGKNKLQRWQRIATESARQSRRPGVMRIAPLTSVQDAIRETRIGGYLSTAPDAISIHRMLSTDLATRDALCLFIGPEGGWTDVEMALFEDAGLRGLRLTDTILRVETAAVAAAALVATRLTGAKPRSTPRSTQ